MNHIVIGACCIGAASLYFVEWSTRVTPVNQLKDLVQLLDTKSKVIVAVSGTVASDAPINCKYSDLCGVILEKTAEKQFLRLINGYWRKDSVSLSTCKEVPWYLDMGTGRVHVDGAYGPPGLVLTVGSEVIEESKQSLGNRFIDFLMGINMIGVKTTERVFPTGTSLTVVGEAVKDNVGSIRIQKPLKGPFYVCEKYIDPLEANNTKIWLRLLYKYGSIGLAVLGVCLLAKPTYEYLIDVKRYLEWQKRIRDLIAKGGQQKEDLSEREFPDLCVICLEHEYNSVFILCGHMCFCMPCATKTVLKKCPICRRKIAEVVKTFRQ